MVEFRDSLAVGEQDIWRDVEVAYDPADPEGTAIAARQAERASEVTLARRVSPVVLAVRALHV